MRRQPMIMVFDDFFEDPDAVRAEALTREYSGLGSKFPTLKAEPESKNYQKIIKRYFEEKILGRPIREWAGGYNTCWHYSLEGTKQHIHHDHGMYSAIVYMTPDAPVEAGTGLYRHKPTGIDTWDPNNPATEISAPEEEWEQVAFVGNVYNRLIVFPAHHYHKAVSTFGDCKENARLSQTFFFS